MQCGSPVLANPDWGRCLAVLAALCTFADPRQTRWKGRYEKHGVPCWAGLCLRDIGEGKKKSGPQAAFISCRAGITPIGVHPLYGSVVSRTTMLNSGNSFEFSSVFSINPRRVLTILTPIS